MLHNTVVYIVIKCTIYSSKYKTLLNLYSGILRYYTLLFSFFILKIFNFSTSYVLLWLFNEKLPWNFAQLLLIVAKSFEKFKFCEWIIIKSEFCIFLKKAYIMQHIFYKNNGNNKQQIVLYNLYKYAKIYNTEFIFLIKKIKKLL